MPRVVCVLGQTGAGKSRLAIELARALVPCGEVVNCDAMQVYAGLPIATAQVPLEERLGVPHHLLGVVDSFTVPGGGITVRDFRDMALPVVEDVIARGRTPVLVGGSDYYLQALVSRSLLDEGGFGRGQGREGASGAGGCEDDDSGGGEVAPALTHREGEEEEEEENDDVDDHDDDDDDDPVEPASQKRLRCDATVPDGVDASAEAAAAAHARLREIDPASAAKLHPKNVRRVRRYLEIFDATGEAPSAIFARQRQQSGGAWGNGGGQSGMRYKALFLVMHASAAELEPALRRRVDGMVEAGLVRELEGAAAVAQARAGASGCGVTQAIGFHEWGSYLRARGFAWTEDTERARERRGDVEELCREAVEAMKADTCRLARRQLRRCHRLRQRFGWCLRFLDSTATHAGLRIGDKAAAAKAWSCDVYDPALAAVNSFLTGEDDDGEGQSGRDGNAVGSKAAEVWVEHNCKACNKTLRGETEWRAHVTSRRHRKRVAGIKKKLEGKHGTLARDALSRVASEQTS